MSLGALGELSVSAARVYKLQDAFGSPGSDGWSYRSLYVPALIPFFVVSVAAFVLYGLEGSVRRRIVSESGQRMVRPIFALLGALGSFFAGSATISNLTFGGIQYSIAAALALDPITLLALQSVGAAMGNMVTINNIVAVCSILGLARQEGFILKRTFGPMILYGVIAVIGARLIFGFG